VAQKDFAHNPPVTYASGLLWMIHLEIPVQNQLAKIFETAFS